MPAFSKPGACSSIPKRQSSVFDSLWKQIKNSCIFRQLFARQTGFDVLDEHLHDHRDLCYLHKRESDPLKNKILIQISFISSM